MKRILIGICILLTVLVLSSCALFPTSGSKDVTQTSTTENQPTAQTLPTNISPTQAQLPTTALPTSTTSPAQPPASTISLPSIDNSVYMDDRSTPAALMLSYYNAVNRQEYLRAYSYWENPSSSQGTLDQFSNGYKDTKSVSIVPGKVSTEGAAGTIYFTLPVVINSVTVNSVTQKFAACYVIKLPQPGNYGAPPITPMEIYKGTAKAVDLSTGDEAALASACTGTDFQTAPNSTDPAVEDLADISGQNYIDNRSGAVEVLKSYLNAFNRNEIVRAYSYWSNAVDFNSFSSNYVNWNQVSAVFGTVTSDPGAGQIYYTVPAVLKVQSTGGTLTTYQACFTLHLSQPGFQAAPPFQPLQIREMKAVVADNNADTNTILTQACQ